MRHEEQAGSVKADRPARFRAEGVGVVAEGDLGLAVEGPSQRAREGRQLCRGGDDEHVGSNVAAD